MQVSPTQGLKFSLPSEQGLFGSHSALISSRNVNDSPQNRFKTPSPTRAVNRKTKIEAPYAHR